MLSSPSAVRAGAGLVVAVLFAASVLPAAHAPVWPDEVRDLAASLAFARAENVPLVGPQINLGPHLGPAWIWLQAPVLPLFATFAGASIYVALVAGLKFALLFALGAVVSGPRLGLCFAAAAGIPSIAVYHWHIFWHPSWLEAGILASLVLTLAAAHRRSVGLLYAGGAALGLAIQLHPTAVFYAPFLAFVLLKVADTPRRRALHLGGLAGVVAIWFAPLLFANTVSHAAGAEAGLSRIAAGLGGFAVADVATVLRTAYVDVPIATGDTYARAAGVTPWAWHALAALAFAAAVAGIVLEVATDRNRRRRMLLFLAGALAIGWIGAVAVRAFTSFYLVFFLLPLGYMLMGLGFDRLLATPSRAARGLAVAAIAAAVACFVIAAVGARAVALRGSIESRLPVLMDLKHPAPMSAKARWVGAAERDAMARFACARQGMVALHGDWAFALAGSTGLDYRLHCPALADNPQILGTEETRPGWTLLSVDEAESIARAPTATFGGLAAIPVKRAVHPARGRPIDPQWHYFEQLRDPQPATRVSLAFSTAAGEAVMVYRLKPFSERLRGLSVRRDGAPAAAALSTHNSDVYLSGGGPGRTEWRIEFETDAPQWMDVHVF